ncbi:sulfatase [bacterium]|nr:sulfatase [bacterium]
MKSFRIIILFFVACVTGILVFRYLQPQRQITPEISDPKSFNSAVLITIDTFRGDHMGYSGNPLIRSPTFDSLTRNATVFTEAFTNLPLTLPAHCAMFTSRFPCDINVQTNVHKLSGDVITLAEILRDHGIKTAGFPQAVLKFSRGHQRGFDFFNGGRDAKKGKGYRNPEQLMVATGLDKSGERNGINQVINWISEREKHGERYFLWLHMFQPHLAYNPPSPVRYVDIEESPEEVDSLIKGLLSRWHKYNTFFTGREIATSRDLYRNEILWVDELIRPLLYHINDRVKDKPFLMITSDHGESLCDRNPYFGHGFNLSREELHIPCLITDGKTRPGIDSKHGNISTQIIQSIDVAPTFLSALDISIPKSFRGSNVMNLANSNRMIPFSIRNPCLQVGALDTNYKVVWSEDEDIWQVWDHIRDPAERNPIIISSRLPDNIRRLKEFAVEYEQLQKRVVRVEKSEEPVNGAFKSMLESLGYLQ